MLTLTTIIKCFVEGQGVYKVTTIDVCWLPLSVIKIFFGKGSYLEKIMCFFNFIEKDKLKNLILLFAEDNADEYRGATSPSGSGTGSGTTESKQI